MYLVHIFNSVDNSCYTACDKGNFLREKSELITLKSMYMYMYTAGVVHLEALDLLSKECESKVRCIAGRNSVSNNKSVK